MDEKDLADRLARIEGRIEQVERLLNLPSPVEEEIPTLCVAEVASPLPAREALVRQVAESIPVAAVHTPPPLEIRNASHLPPPLPLQQTPAKGNLKPPLHSAPKPSIPASPKSPRASLEQTVGLKWTGWIGAVVLLIGAALGIRFVYEQKWLATVPDSVWLSLIALSGFALIGIGEWTYRRVNVIPAASLFGAGVAMLFLASYTGYAYYKLYDPNVAFALMAFSTVVGAAVARRGNMVSIGILSLIGGNITPLVLHTEHPHLGGFLTYISMLQLVALLLVLTAPDGKWWVLRWFSWITTSFWIAVILGGSNFGHVSESLMLEVSCGFAVAYQAELIASASMRRAKPRLVSNQMGIVFSLLVTASLTLVMLWITDGKPVASRLEFLVIQAMFCALLALLLRPWAKDLRHGFALQFWALITLMIPVGLKGQAVILGWDILAITMALLARFRKMPLARGMAGAIWLLAVADLAGRVFNGGASDPIHQRCFAIAGQSISSALILGWLLALTGEVVALLVGKRDSEDSQSFSKIAWILSIASGAVWFDISASELPFLGATLAIIGLAWLLAIADIFTDRLKFAAQAIALLCIAALKWAVVDGIAQRLSPEWSAMAHRPLVNGFVGVALALTFSFPAISMLRRQSLRRLVAAESSQAVSQFTFVIAAIVISLITFAFSLQIDLAIQRAVAQQRALSWPPLQMENFALTMLWCAAVTALWFAHAWIHRHTEMRRPSIGISVLAGLLALKYAVVDLVLSADGKSSAMPGFNLSMLAALAVCLLILGIAMLRIETTLRFHWPNSKWATLAMFIFLWAGSFEIQRAVDQGFFTGPGWPPLQLSLLLWTGWWAGGAIVLYAAAAKFEDNPSVARRFRQLTAGVILLLTIVFLTFDTIVFRIMYSPPSAMVLLNPQALAAAILVSGQVLVWSTKSDLSLNGRFQSAFGFLVMLTTLWIGSLEVDRLFAHWVARAFTNPLLAQQVAISIFWGIFAVLAVALGFRMRAAPMRYFGLGLFAVTLLKIVLIDLGQVSTGYRVLSFMGLGLLLLGTSILYGKLSPRLLEVSGSTEKSASGFSLETGSA